MVPKTGELTLTSAFSMIITGFFQENALFPSISRIDPLNNEIWFQDSQLPSISYSSSSEEKQSRYDSSTPQKVCWKMYKDEA